MKVDETGRSSAPVSVRRARARAKAEGTAPAAPREIADSVSIMGIPEVELTPKVRAAIVTLMAEVEGLRVEAERSRERLAQLERLADQDPLAPIANRRASVRELSRAPSITERYGTPSSLVYFDVNGLKRINDTYGHTAGDEGLLRVANILREHVRDVDVLGRLGGDEFAVILVQTELDQALEKARVARRRDPRQPVRLGRPRDSARGSPRGVCLQAGRERQRRARRRRQGDVPAQARDQDGRWVRARGLGDNIGQYIALETRDLVL